MADLTSLQSAETTKIVGSDSSGLETNPLAVDSNGNIAVTQSGNWDVRNVTGTVSLPTGAATAAKQPALGTAGSPSIDVLSIQGITSMTPLKVDGSGVTQPVSGTVTANQGGTWTVQPGNTANSTAWRVEGQKTSNTTTPGSNNVGVLPAVAATTAPSVTDGNQVALSTDLNGQLRVTSSTTGSEEMTYTVIAAKTAPGNNKSMLSIYNPTASGYVLKLREFYLRNARTTATTGVIGNFQLHRFASGSAPTGGSTVTVVSHDSNDVLPASMDARTGGTISGEIATPLDIIRMSTDEWGPGTLDQEGAQQNISNYLPARAKRDGLLKPFIINAGEGLHIKFATNSANGSIDVVFVFTKV